MPYKDNYTNQSRDKSQYLRENETSPFHTGIGLLITAAVTGTFGYAAVKSGMAKPMIEQLMKRVGSYRGGYIGAVSQGVKSWSAHNEGVMSSVFRTSWLDNLKLLGNTENRMNSLMQSRKDIDNLKGHINIALEKRAEALKSSVIASSGGRYRDPNTGKWVDENHWLYNEPEIITSIKNLNNIADSMQRSQAHGRIDVVEGMYKTLYEKFGVSTERQAEQLKQYGYRHLTLGDIHGKRNLKEFLDDRTAKEINPYIDALLSRTDKDWRKLRLDSNLYISEKGEVADLRVLAKSGRNLVSNISNNFGIPFIHINPIKLLHVDEAFKEPAPLFATLKKGSRTTVFGLGKDTQFVNETGELKEEMYFIAGKLYSSKNLDKPLVDNLHLARPWGVKAKYLREMAGYSLKTFQDVGENEGLRTWWSKVAKKLDIGFQDTDGETLDLANPMSYMSIIRKFLTGVGRPYHTVDTSTLAEDIFGKEAKWIVMSNSVKMRDVINPSQGMPNVNDYFKQFFVGRGNIENVTPMALLPYAFMSRLDNALGSVGIGLSLENKKSAADIYKNLMTRRIFPVIAGAAVLNYSDYMIGQVTGNRPSDEVLDAYANSQINFASFRDLVGLTKLGKHMSKLTPGGEQISDLLNIFPFGGMLDITKSAQDMQDYYTSGEEAVRKGRYWPIGNTPFTGMKVEYYRPNAYIRAKSHWEYTDSLYGSEDEYYANAWFPTPTHPLAPIKHFITNNRWLEEKHYKDRPFPVSVGINEIEGIPIFGEILNNTVGRILKQPKRMHEEYWKGDLLVPIPGDDGEGGAGTGDISGITGSAGLSMGTGVGGSGSGTGDGVGNGKGSTGKQVYVTAGGTITPIQLPEGSNIHQINNQIKEDSLKKSVRGVQQQYIRQDMPEVPMTKTPGYDDIKKDVVEDISELGGMYGFMALGETHDKLAWQDELATPADMNSWSDRFWEENMGGIGGEVSEIYRRFIPRDKNKMAEYNPIRNTMACLLPDTEVLMYSGVCQRAKEIKVGDCLVNKDGDMVTVTGVADFQTNTIVTIQLYGDNMHTLDFSWNHPIYNDNHEFVHAIDIKKGDYVAFPIRHYTGTKTIIDIATFLPTDYIGVTDKYIYYGKQAKCAIENELAEQYDYQISNIPLIIKQQYPKLYDICRYRRNKQRPDRFNRVNRYWDIYDLYYLIGVYAAEGSNNGSNYLKLAGHINDKWEDRICNIFDKYHIVYTKQPGNGTGQNICSSATCIYYILSTLCPGHAKEKYLTQRVVDHNLPKSAIIEMLKGIIDGDGYYIQTGDKRVKCGLHTTSKNLAYQVRNMIIDCFDIAPAITISQDGKDHIHVTCSGLHANILAIGFGYSTFTYNPKQDNQKQYSDGSHVYIKVRRAIIQHGNYKVIGHEVTGDHTFCVSLIATHNTWLPGSDYYLDLRHGDPYRLPYGEIRLPGEAYEKINNMKDPMTMEARASMLGKTAEEMVSYFFHEGDATSSEMQDITDAGTAIHKKLQRQWAKEGFLIDAEVEIKNDKYNYNGHYDARVIDSSSPAKESIIDIKTVNQRKYDELADGGDAYAHNVGQVNVYLHDLGLPKGYLYYVNRDQKDAKPIIKEVWYDDNMYQDQIKTLEEARNIVRSKIDSGERSRGDLYDYPTRLRILADVAPYSRQYQEYKSLMSSVEMDDETKALVKRSEDHAQEQKKSVRMYNYEFSTANLNYESVTVTKVINNNIFMTKEHPDNPIKLAGLHVPTGKDDKVAAEAKEYISKTIHPGAKIQIGYDRDEARQITKDSFSSIRAVVSPGRSHLRNMNQELIRRGLAKENENDTSPAAIHARFSPADIAFGTVWEKIAHLNTFVNTKLLQVRSPYEQYKDRMVYGKDFQDWANPIADYLMPAIETFAQRTPILATASGAIAGLLFGQTPYGKVIGTLIGATVGAVGSMYVHGKEYATDEKWIPNRRRKQRDLNEYMDILKYLKARRLFEQYAHEALEKDGFDVKQYIQNTKEMGKKNKQEANKYEGIKKQLKQDEISPEEALEIADLDNDIDIPIPKDKHKRTDEEIAAYRKKEAVHRLNIKINSISDYRKVINIPELGKKALMYYQQSETTMYGFDAGEPIRNAMLALPKKEREYFQEFLKAPEEEKGKILEIVPKGMRRMLEASWGLPVEDKPKLTEYFQKHELPGADWGGWEEETPLDAIKIKLINHEALTATEFNVWPEQEKQAQQINTPVPDMHHHEALKTVQRKLSDILHGAGFEEVSIDIQHNNTGKVDIHADIQHDKRDAIQAYLKEYGYRLTFS